MNDFDDYPIEVDSRADEQAEFKQAYAMHPAHAARFSAKFDKAYLRAKGFPVNPTDYKSFQTSRSKWTSSDGRETPIEKLETAHLANIIESLRDRAAVQLGVNRGVSTSYHDNKIDGWCEEHIINWFSLVGEAQKRSIFDFPRINLGPREKLSAILNSNIYSSQKKFELIYEMLMQLSNRLEAMERTSMMPSNQK